MTSGNDMNSKPRAEDPRGSATPMARQANWRVRRKLIAEMETEHQQTGNPMAVWAAWWLCRDTSGGFWLPLPPWVVAYLDAFVAQLQDWQKKGPPTDRLAEEIGNALGFRAGRKNQNPITDWRIRKEGEAWFVRFEDHVLGGATPTTAIKRTAEAVHSTESTVRRRLNEFAGGFGMTPTKIVQLRKLRKRRRDEEQAAQAENSHRLRARLAALLRGESDPFPEMDED